MRLRRQQSWFIVELLLLLSVVWVTSAASTRAAATAFVATRVSKNASISSMCRTSSSSRSRSRSSRSNRQSEKIEFLLQQRHYPSLKNQISSEQTSSSTLHMFGPLGDFFNNWKSSISNSDRSENSKTNGNMNSSAKNNAGNTKNPTTLPSSIFTRPSASSFPMHSNVNPYDDDDDRTAGMTRIVDIPVKSMRPGGLRLFLMFYLLGMQNTPEKNTWKADQPDTGDVYVLDYWYRNDASGMLSIELQETSVVIDRLGSQPSNQYLIQERYIVDGILDELQQCAFEEGVAVENRLLELQSSTSIDAVRSALAFG